jgi:hypothetical protein
VRAIPQLQRNTLSAIGFYAPLMLLALVLSALIASRVPEFTNKDSQYYIQAGPLWLHGNVKYSGSFVGSRHLAILTYLLPRLVFGESLSVIALTLAAINLAFNLCVAALAAAYIGRGRLSLVVAAIVMLAASAAPIWNSPLTDNLLVLTAAVALLIRQRLCMSARPRMQYFGVSILGLACGILMGWRSEAAIIWVMCLATWAICRAPIEAGAKRVTGIALSVAAFVIFTMAQPLLFRAWTGVERPAQLTGLLLFWKPLDLFHAGRLAPRSSRDIGPANATLAGWLKPPHGMSEIPIDPMFYASGFGEKEVGDAKTSKVFLQAGLELVMRRPLSVLRSTFTDAVVCLSSQDATFDLDERTNSERLAATLAQLHRIDEVRVRAAEWLNGDSHWPVFKLAESPSAVPAWQTWLKSVLPPQLQAYLPAWAFDFLLLAGTLIVIGLGRWESPLAVSIPVILCLVFLTAFSQGYALRYWLIWYAILILTFPLEIGRMVISSVSKSDQSSGPLSLTAPRSLSKEKASQH